MPPSQATRAFIFSEMGRFEVSKRGNGGGWTLTATKASPPCCAQTMRTPRLDRVKSHAHDGACIARGSAYHEESVSFSIRPGSFAQLPLR